MNPVLEQVRNYADEAHGQQLRKYTPDRYIVHPERVMKTCADYTNHLPTLAAALLHDVLEDTPVTEGALNRYLASVMSEPDAAQTTRLVVELTDVYTKEQYPYWNRKKRKRNEVARMARISAEAQTIKYADILDNCSEIVEHDPQFAPRFLRECKTALEHMHRGNRELYQRSQEAVVAGLAKLDQRR